ncbi:glycosyltransferase [Microbacterium sp. Marseille-Q6648]|uniref:glycosyltransferase family 2 protein n=1 Tax=Microbacterium sp. Marseille-Q6648 TaxID=2937991 RepID=UPI0020406FAD|nr:glycosyltransferase [Microbacterium sp. Marseille-Q6648]
MTFFDTPRPRLTVCIVTFERTPFLLRCLTSIRSELTADTQVVVVDASAVSAEQDVQALGRPVDYIHDTSVAGWMTRARNRALLSARGEIITFLDDDVVLRPGWQSAVLTAFADPSVDAVAGRTCNGLPGEETYAPPIGRLLDDGSLTEGFASLPDGQVDVDHGIGANMSFRASTLARLGGFRDDYPGTAIREDTDLYLRIRAIGGRAVFSPDAAVDHLPAPHVKGARFDTRYKLYGRRNHMVLLAREGGIRSRRLAPWIAAQLRSAAQVPGLVRKLQRFGVTVLGIGWGALAMLRQARWNPLPPERTDAAGREIRAALTRAAG